MVGEQVACKNTDLVLTDAPCREHSRVAAVCDARA